MKKIALILFTVTTSSVFAQQQLSKVKEKEISNAEKFSDVSGTLIKKEIIEIGDVKKCKIQVAKYTDLIASQNTSAIRFEYEYKSTYTSDTKIALLDADEIEGLLKSIKLIQDKIFPTVSDNYTEVNFKSRSGFSAGCFSEKKGWATFIKLEKFDSNSYVFMDKEELDKLANILEEAKNKL